MPFPSPCCARSHAFAQSQSHPPARCVVAVGKGHWEPGVSPRPTSDTSRQGLVSPPPGQATPIHLTSMRLNLATISLPSSATGTRLVKSPTGPSHGAHRGRGSNQAFDAATVLDSSLRSSSTLAETASRASCLRASGLHWFVLSVLAPAWSDGPNPRPHYCLAAMPYSHSLHPPSRKSPLLRLHPLHPIPYFCSGEHQSLPGYLTSSSSCGLFFEFGQAQSFRTAEAPRYPRDR